MGTPFKDSNFYFSKEELAEMAAGLEREPAPEDPVLRAQFLADRIGVCKMLFSSITTFEFPDSEVVELWNNVSRHRNTLNAALGRDVGFRVATLDYLFNVEQRILNLMIVDNISYEKMLSEAQQDFKTGLLNARSFYHQIDNEIDRAGRFGEVFTLLFIDLDNFKQFNDTQGHLAGDALLESFAHRLKEQLRSIDVAGRYGGDEFCVFFPETNRGYAMNAVNRIQRILGTIVDERIRRETGISLSGGLVMYPFNGTTRRQLFQEADRVLYEAKHSGKDRICLAADTNNIPVFRDRIRFLVKAREDRYTEIPPAAMCLNDNGLSLRLPDVQPLADPELLGFHIRLELDNEEHTHMIPRERVRVEGGTAWLCLSLMHEKEAMGIVLQHLDAEKTFLSRPEAPAARPA